MFVWVVFIVFFGGGFVYVDEEVDGFFDGVILFVSFIVFVVIVFVKFVVM